MARRYSPRCWQLPSFITPDEGSLRLTTEYARPRQGCPHFFQTGVVPWLLRLSSAAARTETARSRRSRRPRNQDAIVVRAINARATAEVLAALSLRRCATGQKRPAVSGGR